MNAFAKHYEKNFELYEQLMDAGVLSEKDMTNAINADGDISYKDQDEALMRIRDAVKNNLDLEDSTSKEFYEGIPQIEKFTPNKEEWMNYNQEQMGRLAEQMKFNWKNKEDRKEMMKILSNETIKRDKQKIYEDYKKEHPIAAFINENILAPNVSERSKKGEDITNKDVLLDAANIGTYFMPGAGAAAGTAGKAALFAADAAAQGAVGALSDINQGNELGMHNVVNPLIGAGMGATMDILPGIAKGGVDIVTNNFGGKVGKKIGDKVENVIKTVFGNEVKDAKKALQKEAADEASKKTLRKNASEASRNDALFSGDVFTTAQNKQFKKDKVYYSEHPEKMRSDFNKGKLSKDKVIAMMSDPKFKTAYKGNQLTKTQQFWKDVAQQGTMQLGKGIAIEESNRSRHKNAKPKIEDVFSDPEMADYIRLRRRGYSPQIPSKFKDYKDAVDAEIFDYRKNLLGE